MKFISLIYKTFVDFEGLKKEKLINFYPVTFLMFVFEPPLIIKIQQEKISKCFF